MQIEDLVVLKSQRDGIIGCKGHFVVMIYDNFGLDDKDIQQFPGDILFPFWGWYILQHHTKFDGKYKPFINQIILKYDMGDYIGSPVFSNQWKVDNGFIREW